jgi:Tfp pilus assembly protein PilO
MMSIFTAIGLILVLCVAIAVLFIAVGTFFRWLSEIWQTLEDHRNAESLEETILKKCERIDQLNLELVLVNRERARLEDELKMLKNQTPYRGPVPEKVEH